MNFRDRLIRFMYGRYGVDALWYGLLALYIILALIELVLPIQTLAAFRIVRTMVVVVAFYRMLSRNIMRRRKENELFLKFLQPFKVQFKRLRDIRTHVYRRCPHCGKMLRFPRKKGRHSATCPMCHQPFDVNVRF